MGVLLLSTLAFQNCSKSSPAEDKSASRAGSFDSASTPSELPSPYTPPPAFAERLRDYRKKWTRISDFDLSGLHWNQYVTIYVNKDPEKYVQNFREYLRVYINSDGGDADTAKPAFQVYSTGTIFLKEHYQLENGRPGKPLNVAMMIKREKGYDPGAGDWQYVYFDINGNTITDGNSSNPVTHALCAKCHGNIGERDYIFSSFCSLPQSAN